MATATINYIEFPSADLAATEAFFSKVFGWRFTHYGPDYSAFSDPSGAGIEGGFYRAELVAATAGGSALLVFYTSELEIMQQQIIDAGGCIIKETFSFPGGRRFHFTEPAGNELAVWSDQ